MLDRQGKVIRYMQLLLFSRSLVSDSLWPLGLQAPGFPVPHYLPEFALTHDHWVDDAIQPSHPLLPLLLLPAIFPSIRVFSNESALCIRCPNYWSFSFSINPPNEYSGWPVSRLPCPWGFSRQEYYSGLPCPPPGDLPNPGIKHRFPTLQADSLPTEPPGKPATFWIMDRDSGLEITRLSPFLPLQWTPFQTSPHTTIWHITLHCVGRISFWRIMLHASLQLKRSQRPWSELRK